METKLIIPNSISFEQLNIEIETGAKFIAYSYCLSILFAVTLKPISPAYLILSNENNSKYKSKYNLLTKLFGWWGIPWGPIESLKSLRTNNAGGIDITNDVMSNITAEAFKNRAVCIEIIHDIFSKLDKSTKSEFLKSAKIIEENRNIQSMIVGVLYISNEQSSPHYVVGLSGKSDYQTNCNEVEVALYKRFRKHVKFEFINLDNFDEDDEYVLKLIEQGDTIISKDSIQ